MKDFYPLSVPLNCSPVLRKQSLPQFSPALMRKNELPEGSLSYAYRRYGGSHRFCVVGKRSDSSGRISGGTVIFCPMRTRADICCHICLCAGAVLNVSVVAQTPVTVMFLNVRRILSVCTSACSHHSRIIRNLLGELADKNLMLSEKSFSYGAADNKSKGYVLSLRSSAKKAEPMNLIFLFPVSSSPTISLSSAADCPLNSVKCVMRDCWNSTKAIFVLKV